MSKNKSNVNELVASATVGVAVGAAVGSASTYAIMKNSCADCDCEKYKLEYKTEYKNHKNSGRCDIPEQRCDTCPEGPKI